MKPAALRDIDRTARPYACCRDARNLRCEEIRTDIFIEHCTCGRRHHIVEADPVKVGVTGAGMGL